MKFLFSYLGMVFLLGCTQQNLVQERDPFAEDDAGQKGDLLSVSLRVLVPDEHGERLLLGEEELHNGDGIAFVVRTSETAFLNVVMMSPKGTPTIHFPDEGFTQVPKDCSLRIPSRGFIYLQEPAGPENLRVVASREPLSQADSRLCQALQLPCTTPAVPARLAPCTLTSAAPQKHRRGLTPLVKRAQDDGAGVASVATMLKHVP